MIPIRRKICMITMAPMLFDARIQREAQSLSRAGYKIVIIYLEDQLMLNGIKELRKAKASYDESMKGIVSKPIYLSSRSWKWLPKILSHIIQAIELFMRYSYMVTREKADIYHIHDLKPGIFGLMGKGLHGGKLVYDAHEIEITTAGKRFQSVMIFYERWIIGKSCLNITVNEEIKLMMETAYRKPVIVLANKPAYIEFSAIARKNLQLLFKLPEKSKVLMYIGYVVPKVRGVELVIEAMKHLPQNVFLLIMAVGRINEFKSYLLDYCKERELLKIYERVLFIGPFPPEEIVNYLHSADISVMLYQKISANSSSNAPNKLFQSIMARTPILASHNETFPKIIYNNKYGKIGETVNESDTVVIARVITEILDNDSLGVYRENANLLSLDISWEAEANKLISTYNQI